MKKALILGAGISGLSFAWYLRKRFSKEALDITIIEPQNRIGGALATMREGDFVFEAGPRCLRGDGALPLFKDLDLMSECIEASSHTKKKYLAHSGKLVDISSPLTLLFNPIGRICLKAILGYPFRKKIEGKDLSCDDYFSSRFGRDFVDHIINPMLAGIWGADPKNLSFKATLGAMKLSSQKLYTLTSGLDALPRRIVEKIEASLLLNTLPIKIEETSSAIHVHTKDATHSADILFSSLHPDELKPLLISDPLYSILPDVPRAGIIVCAMGYREDLLKKKGFGFLASSLEEKELLGISFDSAIFPSVGKPYETRLSCMFGGERAPHMFSLSDEEIKEKARLLVRKYLEIECGEDVSSIVRAPNSISLYPVNHLEHVRICEESAQGRRIVLFGSGLYGISVPQCIEKSRTLAGHITW